MNLKNNWEKFAPIAINNLIDIVGLSFSEDVFVL